MKILKTIAFGVLLLATGCTLLSTPEVVFVTATPDPRAVVTTSAAFARECPYLGCGIIFRVSYGEPLTVVAHNDQPRDFWLQVEYEGQTAWVQAIYLSIPDATLEQTSIGEWSTPSPTAAVVQPESEVCSDGCETATGATTEGWPGEGVPGLPVSEWRGVPVMPGAIAGSEEGPHGIFYLYATEASLEQVVYYYLDEMPERGWEVEIADTYVFLGTDNHGFAVSFPDIPSAEVTYVQLAALY